VGGQVVVRDVDARTDSTSPFLGIGFSSSRVLSPLVFDAEHGHGAAAASVVSAGEVAAVWEAIVYNVVLVGAAAGLPSIAKPFAASFLSFSIEEPGTNVSFDLATDTEAFIFIEDSEVEARTDSRLLVAASRGGFEGTQQLGRGSLVLEVAAVKRDKAPLNSVEQAKTFPRPERACFDNVVVAEALAEASDVVVPPLLIEGSGLQFCTQQPLDREMLRRDCEPASEDLAQVPVKGVVVGDGGRPVQCSFHPH
jgi:hypothetical protein